MYGEVYIQFIFSVLYLECPLLEVLQALTEGEC